MGCMEPLCVEHTIFGWVWDFEHGGWINLFGYIFYLGII